jgi:hypothetical protein
MRHATALLYHVCAVASRNTRFASCGTSGKLTLRTRYILYFCYPFCCVCKNFVTMWLCMCFRGGSPEKLWINSLRRNDDVTRKPSESSCKNSMADHSLWNPSSLKTAAQYKPPPVSHSAASPRNVHPCEEAPRMKFAFEMHLGNSRSPTSSDKEKDSPPSKSSKFRNLFSSKQSHHQKQNFLELSGSQNSHRNQHKTILGSPRLHRAIFKDKKCSATSESSSGSVSSPTSGGLCDWATAEYGSQADPSMAQFKVRNNMADNKFVNFKLKFQDRNLSCCSSSPVAFCYGEIRVRIDRARLVILRSTQNPKYV